MGRLAFVRQCSGAMKNLYADIPDNLDAEQFEALLRAGSVRIERILSRGQTSPAQGWYDQTEHEWVLVLEGRGIIGFADGREIKLQKGDCLNIPAHVKHKVKWTDPDNTTIWLCVFYKD